MHQRPRKPGRWTWAVAGRLCGRAFVAFVLLALVGWPERHEYVDNFRGVRGGGGAGMDRRFFARDADLRVLVDALTE